MQISVLCVVDVCSLCCRCGDPEEPVDERLKNIEPKMVELITNEIIDHGPSIGWDDIAGLEFAKKTVHGRVLEGVLYVCVH